ncbi:SixA phosphatase family protein [Rubrobacter indicoceani]|uniref:SixA phosphatase family protein n=1 Tax=Rubrobacter indicoceani TaxID=2051957 RepID=UPI0013C468D4|nr:histidine phosphatase family protein [Rubrobacter indicoceani]
MDLYLIRHAIAHARDPDRWPEDSNRPLSSLGKSRFERVAAEVSSFVTPPHRLLTSSFARAWQTAQILHEIAGWPVPESFPPLAADVSPEETAKALAGLSGGEEQRLALVGHRPNLHELASHLLTGKPDGMNIKIKKGGVLYLSFDARSGPGSAELRWHTTPKMALRRVGSGPTNLF